MSDDERAADLSCALQGGDVRPVIVMDEGGSEKLLSLFGRDWAAAERRLQEVVPPDAALVGCVSGAVLGCDGLPFFHAELSPFVSFADGGKALVLLGRELGGSGGSPVTSPGIPGVPIRAEIRKTGDSVRLLRQHWKALRGQHWKARWRDEREARLRK